MGLPFSNIETFDTAILEQVKELIKEDKLEPALADFFISRNETALQLRYAKVIADKLLDDWLPTLKVINEKIIALQNIKYSDVKLSENGISVHTMDRDLPEPELSTINENINQLWKLQDALRRYNRSIIQHIKDFAPDLYDQYVDKFSVYIPLVRIAPVPANMETYSKGPMENPDQLKSKSRFDPAENPEFPTLNFIITNARFLAKSAIHSQLGLKFSISENLVHSTNYFSIENRNEWDSSYESLNNELIKWFLQQSDSRIQDRFANYLISILFDLLGPLWHQLDSIVDYWQDQNRNLSLMYLDENGSFCERLRYLVQNWIFCIWKNILDFAPERYIDHKVELDRFLPMSMPASINSKYSEEKGLLNELPQQEEHSPKKPRKKKLLTHKRQMVLAEILGLTQHELLKNLTPRQRGVILGELLNRSVDDTENMLNPVTSKGDKKLDWDDDYE